MSNETWKDVIGYEGSYKVSNLGNVRSVDRMVNGGSGMRLFPGRLRKQSLATNGYKVVSLSALGVVKVRCVHDLVLRAFVGAPPSGMECCHRDGNRLNNNLLNLRWGTRKSNAEDRGIHGTQIIGSRARNSRLTESQVFEIKRHLAAGRAQTDIAADYGVAIETIHSIKTGKSWRHVDA